MLLLHMSAMNSLLLNYRSFLYSIPLSHMQLQNYIYYLKWAIKIQKIMLISTYSLHISLFIFIYLIVLNIIIIKKQKKLWIYLEIWIEGIIFANVSDIYN